MMVPVAFLCVEWRRCGRDELKEIEREKRVLGLVGLVSGTQGVGEPTNPSTTRNL